MTDRPGEDDLIARFFAPLAGPAGLGLKDDVALLSPPAGRDLVVTTDALVAGVHFFADDPPDAIARKALRVNLSDLAAKGAEPLGFTLDLALPNDWTADWLAAFAAGLGKDAAYYRCPLLGGDTVRTPGPLTLAITALGAVARQDFAARAGVRAGDWLYVSGTIGDAALGLKVRRGEGPTLAEADRAWLLDRYLLPQPRLELASAMARFASAGMDVSDGFVGDLTKMLRVSGVTATIDMSRLPLSPAAAAAMAIDPSLFPLAASGGDDYELIAATPPSSAVAFEAAAAAAGVAVTRVGEAVAGESRAAFRRSRRQAGQVRARFVQSFLKSIIAAARSLDPVNVEASAFVHRLLVAAAVAREAGQVAKRRFLDRTSFTIGFKGPQDYLTEVDGEVERLIATRLHAAFPGDGFIGEEGEGRAAKPGQPIWVVDPIDGTSNFARGAPHFCVSIAAVVERQVEVGVIYDPMVDELFAARRGGGATLNGQPIRAASTGDLKAAIIEVGWNMRSSAEAFLALFGRVVTSGRGGDAAAGSGALALAYVAAGRRDGYVENHINAWDCLAGVAIAREAGAYVSDFLAGDGLKRGAPIVACAPTLEESLVAVAAIPGLAL